MHSTICYNCGTDREYFDGVLHCPACGFVSSDTTPPKAQKALSSAFLLLRASSFDEAKKAFEDIIQKYPECAEAYFGRLRARYHIGYARTADGKAVPTCPTRSGKNILGDVDYQKAISCASEEYKTFLQAVAEAVKKFCTDNASSKNVAFQFTFGNVDPTDEFIPYPNADMPSLQAERKKRLSAAFVLLDESRFDDAKAGFEAVLSKEPTSAAAYWGRLRARYHITYTEVFDGVFAPLCPTRSGANLTKDTDYRKAMEYADEAWKSFLQEQAAYLELICTRAKQPFPMGEVDPNDEFIKPSPKERLRNVWKKNKKRILALSAVFTFLFFLGLFYRSGAIPVYAKNGLELRLTGDSTFRVSGNGFCRDSNIVIPSKYLGIPVTGIDEAAFFGCENLTGITIPDSVTRIRDSAFGGCTGLTEIVIPESVTSIEDSAFYGCTNLKSITLPLTDFTDCLGYIFGATSFDSQEEFVPASLKTVVITDSVTSIGNYTFRSCSSLTEIVIPDSVTSIGNSAFAGCSSLTEIVIPDSVTSIGNSAFAGCSSLTDITISAGVTSICDNTFAGCSSLTGIMIPEGVTSIGRYAFHDCSSLTDVVIPDSVTSIAFHAFHACNSLTDIVIPDSVTSIGSAVFEGCTKLESLTLPFIGNKPNGEEAYLSYMFGAYSSSDAERVPTSLNTVVITGSSSIGKDAFRDCTGLTSLVITGSLSRIGSHAFYGCTGLTSVTLRNGLISIGENAFYGCTGLTDITVPDGVNRIEAGAFYLCDGLTSITIPRSVTSIGEQAFSGCSSLTSISFGGTVEQWNAISFGDIWNLNTGNYTVTCTDGTISK